jgi:hypothetical protein
VSTLTTPHIYRVPLDDSSDDQYEQVHACLRTADANFRPWYLPISAIWSGSTLRMNKCFRKNLLGGGPPKTQTMRPEWCSSTIKQHKGMFDRGIWFRVNCVRTVGWAHYLSVDIVQLQDLTTCIEDCIREGRPSMTVVDFLTKFLERGAIPYKDAYTRKSGKHVPARIVKPVITPLTSAHRFKYQFVPCKSSGARG